MSGSPAGGLASGKEPPKHLALKASRSPLQELHGTRGNRDSSLAGHTQVLTHTRTQAKGAVFIEAWARPTCWSWKGPQGKAGVAVAHTGGGGMGEYSLESGDCYFDTKTWPHLTACRHPVLG